MFDADEWTIIRWGLEEQLAKAIKERDQFDDPDDERLRFFWRMGHRYKKTHGIGIPEGRAMRRRRQAAVDRISDMLARVDEQIADQA